MRDVLIFLLVLIVSTTVLFGQEVDIEQTTIPIEVPKKHSPKRAGWYSAALPGLGQGYNKKYWKIPIVWAGFAATGHFIATNAVPMAKARAAYMWMSNGSEGEPPNEMIYSYDTPQKLLSVYYQYRNQVELFSIITVVWYALNIIDAVVDAHLKDFDVSQDLSMSISPFILPDTKFNSEYSFVNGITITLKF